MKLFLAYLFVFAASVSSISCRPTPKPGITPMGTLSVRADSIPEQSYDDIKRDIAFKRKEFALNATLNDSSANKIRDFWVDAIANRLYSKWQNTPWDFNGVTRQPQHGAIACGYFVATLLQDMDCDINRVK